MMGIFGAALVLISLGAGLLAGYALSLMLIRSGMRRPLKWPAIAMVISAPCAGFPAVMCATLTGGWAEEVLGTTWGVPLGIFVGSAAMTLAAGFISGSVGLLIAHLTRVTRGGEEPNRE
jgi:hypothetical protein